MLLKYLKNRYKSEPENIITTKNIKGAVITISRQCACSAINLAEELSSLLRLKTGNPWPVISKEILEESAHILKLDSASDLDYIFKSEPKGALDEILSAFSKKYFYSDKKVRNTIYKVINNYALNGNCIIIGRGGVSLTKDLDRSFNIKLQASLNWRVDKLQEIYKLSNNEMLQYIKDVDVKRKHLRDNFNGADLEMDVYDVVFNVEKLHSLSLSDICMGMIEEKLILE